MPIYEYQCQACSHAFETIQRFSDTPLAVCPACDRPQLKKLISRVSFRLKGSGWYETDFKNKNKKDEVQTTAESAEPSKTTTAEKKVSDTSSTESTSTTESSAPTASTSEA